MTCIAIEINDVALLAVDESGLLRPPSPGYALLDGETVAVGEAARRAARLKPRLVSHRHWDRLDLEAVGPPFPPGSSHADLVYAHLARFWDGLVEKLGRPDSTISVLLAVPGSYSPEQLGLLLGIARACEMPVTGLVDTSLAAVAAGGGSARAQRCLHLDLHQHRAVWTVIEAGERLRRRRVESLEGVGLMRLQQRWMELIADRFVRRTRYDPLHGGASEQALFDRLSGWIREAALHGSVEATLEVTHPPSAVEVTAAQLAAAVRDELDALVAAPGQFAAAPDENHIVLSARAANVPGLAERLAEVIGSDVEPLTEGAAATGAVELEELIESPADEPSLVLELPVPERHG